MNFFPDFAPNSRKRVPSVAFQSILRKQIRKLPKILKSDSVKIIQYYSQSSFQIDPNSILFNRVLSGELRRASGEPFGLQEHAELLEAASLREGRADPDRPPELQHRGPATAL